MKQQRWVIGSIQCFSSNRVDFIEEQTSLEFMMLDELIDHRVLHWSQKHSWCVLFPPEVDRRALHESPQRLGGQNTFKILQRNLSTAQTDRCCSFWVDFAHPWGHSTSNWGTWKGEPGEHLSCLMNSDNPCHVGLVSYIYPTIILL